MSDTLAYKPLAGARLNMSHPLAENMVLCMLLNEQGSRAMDLSPSAAHGALTGFGSPAKRAFNGLQFTAATPSYIEIPASFTQLNFTSEDFSIIMRCRIDILDAHRHLFNRGSYKVEGYTILIVVGDDLRFRTHQLGEVQETVTGFGAIVIDTWYTFGFSRLGTSATIYSNGIDVTLTHGTHLDPTTCARTVKIGIEDDLTSNPFDGKLEFLYVWGRRELTAFEHQAIHISPYNPLGTPMFI